MRDFEPQLAKVSAVYYTLISKLVLRPLKEKTIASKGMRQPLANALQMFDDGRFKKKDVGLASKIFERK